MSSRRRIDIMDFFEKISLAQKISAKHREYQEYTGSDMELAKGIANLNVLIELGIISEEVAKLPKALLVEQNKASFASSEKTDVFTKLGLLYPKAERVFGVSVKKREEKALE